MTDTSVHLTAQEYASRAGVSTSTVTKWLRDGTIEGKKISGRWMIPESQLQTTAAPGGKSSATAPATTGAKKDSTPSFTVEAFAERTYLTPKGVERYLKNGTLVGEQDADGRWKVDAKSLEL
ncbi:MAG: helix-turn-helix domain-containing protein, partial [Desulfobacteraceae bacterium]|nr:helix-turn-helix domain-containing protein [Desulfobacteraceae bacterium]